MALRIVRQSLTTLALLALPAIALAHGGTDAGMHHDHGIVEFITHFFADLDHLLMTLAVAIVVGLIYKLRRAA